MQGEKQDQTPEFGAGQNRYPGVTWAWLVEQVYPEPNSSSQTRTVPILSKLLNSSQRAFLAAVSEQ